MTYQIKYHKGIAIEMVHLDHRLFGNYLKEYDLKLKVLTDETINWFKEAEYQFHLVGFVLQKVIENWESQSVQMLRYWFENSSRGKFYNNANLTKKYQLITYLLLDNDNNRGIKWLLKIWLKYTKWGDCYLVEKND